MPTVYGEVGEATAVAAAVAALLAATNVGTVATPATTVAEEHGDGLFHVTKLTFTAFSLGNGGDNQDLAIGAKCYTFPAGTIQVLESTLVGVFTSAASVTVIADSQCGAGTVVASGAVDTLAEVGSTSENIIKGQQMPTSYNANGGTTVEYASWTNVDGGTPLLISAAGVHDMFLNFAATWPNVTAPAGFTFTGKGTVAWRLIS